MTLKGMFCLVTVFALLVLVYVNTYGLSSFYSSKYTSPLRATPRPSFSTITKRTTARKNSTSLLKKTPCFSTITKREIARDPLKNYFLDQSLEQLYHFNSCAVVSSSHALKQHQYGAEIDKHDCVLRFGCAPTKTFERHVGSRTDIRLINTRVPQIFCKQEFLNDSIQMFNQEVVVVRHNNAFRIIGEKVNTAHDRYDSLPKYIEYINTHSDRQLFIQGQAFGPMIIRDLQEFCRKHTECKWSNNNGASTGVFGMYVQIYRWQCSIQADLSVARQYPSRSIGGKAVPKQIYRWQGSIQADRSIGGKAVSMQIYWWQGSIQVDLSVARQYPSRSIYRWQGSIQADLSVVRQYPSRSIGDKAVSKQIDLSVARQYRSRSIGGKAVSKQVYR
ncbi:ST6GAL1 [Branchiostoma lanceolatum]|uniref:beta-galactoside alpha-(2,6)-sialyltransferase n=1 Tax=Branchiostoma lanceolatum TaxID=7740 RepID=A0A8J9ZP05_BRALA|nr:ST6GAL1 [Branchiostoma lanceolatum]